MAINTTPKVLIRGFGNNAPASTPPSAWTPASLTGIQEWWYTGAGVSQTGGAVQSWTGQINSTVLTKNTGTGMTYTAADAEAGNKPTIAQNASRNLATLQNSNITTFTPTIEHYIGYIGIAKQVSGTAYRILGQQTSSGGSADEMAFFITSQSGEGIPGFYFYLTNGGGSGRRTGTGVATEDQLFWMLVSVASNGISTTQYYNSTTGTTLNVTGAGYSDLDPLNWEIGGYQNNSGLNWGGKVMESFWCNGAPTTTDLNNLNTYVTDTYS